jgi:hypothetical protein
VKYPGIQRRAASCGPKCATALDWHTLQIEVGPYFGNAWILGDRYLTQNSQNSQIPSSFWGYMRGLKIRVKRSYHWHPELPKSSQSLVTINQAKSSLPQRCQKVPIISTKESRKFSSFPTADSYLLWCGKKSIYIFLLKKIFLLSSILWKDWSSHRTNSDERTLMSTKVSFSKPKNIPKPKTG